MAVKKYKRRRESLITLKMGLGTAVNPGFWQILGREKADRITSILQSRGSLRAGHAEVKSTGQHWPSAPPCRERSTGRERKPVMIA